MKKIFLSSTATDLADYRQALYDALGCLEGYHCVRMENFGARDSSADEFDARKIEECDLFVGVIGFFHGSTPKDSQRSFTELEYKFAVALGKPRLMFVASSEEFLGLKIAESAEKKQKQERFRQRVAAERVVADFMLPQDLVGKVITAIFNWEAEQSQSKVLPQGGSLEWMTIPCPPQPYFAHPYPLQDHFTGRFRERQMLTDWLMQGSHSVLALVGIGGLGKSALVWFWLHKDILSQPVQNVGQSYNDKDFSFPLPDQQQPAGILWWSFYDTDATFSAFLDEAIVYITENKTLPGRITSIHAKARILFSLLQQHRILIVLDGFERLLRAYAGLNGAYQGDDESIFFLTDPCACVDVLVARFLSWIASSPMASRVLITSRLFPKELYGVEGIPLSACRREDMESLDAEDALDLFRAIGVRGTRMEIQSACAAYGYHALTLRLLAGYIVNHFLQPGEISVALKFNPLRNLVARQHNILDLAYNALTPNEQQLLSRMAAFRSPVDYKAIRVLSSYENDEELEQSLQHLVHRGLLLFERSSIRFDLHPIVRRYAYEHLADKKQVHSQLRDYFAGASLETSSDTLSPIVELYHHTIQSGLNTEGYKLYTNRLDKPLGVIGAYNMQLELLQALFEDINDFGLLLDDPKDQVSLLTHLAIAYGYTGQTRLAVNLYEKEIEISSKLEDQSKNRRSIGNISFFQMRMGELASAEEYQRQSLAKATQEEDVSNVAYGHLRLGLILSYCGRLGEARDEFLISRSLFCSIKDPVGECHLWNYRVIRAHLIKDNSLAFVCALKSLNLAETINDGRLLTRSKNLMAMALLDLASNADSNQSSRFSDIETLLSEALACCRQHGLLELEASIMLNWARWYRLKKEIQLAKNAAEEALIIATRCEYRLEQVEIHNFLSLIAFENGNNSLARQHSLVATEIAVCDGSPHSFKIALEEAHNLLIRAGK